MENPDRSTRLFTLANTIFWILLAVLLFSSRRNLLVGGSILSVALGALILYLGRRHAGNAMQSALALASGVAAVLIGGALLIYALFGGGAAGPEQVARERIALVAGGQTSNLDLSGLGLTDVDPQVWQLSDLNYLNLSDNRLTALPPEIGRLTGLEHLYLDGNDLGALPPEIGRLAELRILSASGNRLAALPAEIGALGALESLFLYDNRLTALPPEMAHLSALKFLHLDRNQLTELPPGIADLPDLQALGLRGNPLGALPPDLVARAQASDLQVEYDDDVPAAEPSSDGSFTGVVYPVLVLALLILAFVAVAFGFPRWLANRQSAPAPDLDGGAVPVAAFPYHLEITGNARTFGWGGTLLLLALYLGIGLAGLWWPWLRGETPHMGGAAFLFGAMSFFFLPALFIFVRGILNPEQPVEMLFTADEIRFRYPGGVWQALPAAALSNVALEPAAFHVSVVSLPARVWAVTQVYHVVLHFAEGRTLRIDQDRARQFGVRPEALYGALRRLYP